MLNTQSNFNYTYICLPVFLVNYGLVLIITNKIELKISGHVVQRFWSKTF